MSPVPKRAVVATAFASILVSCLPYVPSTAKRRASAEPRLSSVTYRDVESYGTSQSTEVSISLGILDTVNDGYLLAENVLEERPIFSVAPMDIPVQLGVAVPIEDPSGKALSAFYAALRRAETGAGQAHVVFYGASHVASDYYTGYLRQHLQARFGEAGPGFVMPAKPWRWYRNAGIAYEASRGWKSLHVLERLIKEDRYGLAGVALDADRRRPAHGAIKTRSNGPLSGTASRFELYFLKQPNGGQLQISIDDGKPRQISTAASDFEPAYETIETTDGLHRFDVKTLGNGALRLFGVAVENDKPGVILDTLGIPGARVGYQLAWDDAVYREHLRRRRPDLVVLAYGTNEAGDKDVPIEYYERDLRKVIARLRDVVPDASCLLVGPSDRPLRVGKNAYEPRPRTAQIIEVQMRVAGDFACGFFDLVACTGGPMSMVAWAASTPRYGAADHVHFTPTGYYRIGEILLHALLANYSSQEASPATKTNGTEAN